jgi:hemerythrin superfamily protein
MKATDIILRDHRAAEDLFETFKGATPDAQEVIAKDLFDALATHEKMEDKHFYPALEEAAGDDPAIDDITGEQTRLEMEVMAIRAMSYVAGESEDRIAQMMDKVLAHAREEESVILPMAEELLSAERLEELGATMEPDSAVANAPE